MLVLYLGFKVGGFADAQVSLGPLYTGKPSTKKN